MIDNHSAHNSADIRALCKRLQIVLHFQPPFSPEFNSIEMLWGIIKARLALKLVQARDYPMDPDEFSMLV